MSEGQHLAPDDGGKKPVAPPPKPSDARRSVTAAAPEPQGYDVDVWFTGPAATPCPDCGKFDCGWWSCRPSAKESTTGGGKE